MSAFLTWPWRISRVVAVKELFFSYRRNSSFFLTVVFSALLGVAFVVTWSFIGYFTVQHQYDLLDDEMREIVGSTFSIQGGAPSTGKLIKIVEARSQNQIPTGPYVYLLWDAARFENRWLAGNLGSVPEFDYDAQGRGRFKVAYDGKSYAYYGRAIRIHETYVLLVGRKVTHNAVLSKPFFWTLFALFMTILGVWGSTIFSNYLTRRMQNFNATISEVMDGADLSRRIELQQTEDQIGKTARLFNEMMDRLQISADHGKMATQEIAHRMVHDVWKVQSLIDKSRSAIDQSKDREKIAETIESAANAAHDLRTRIDGLYELICIKNQPIVKAEVGLQDLINTCQINDPESVFQELVRHKRIDVLFNKSAFRTGKILASEVHLKAAIDNLLVNAAKYTPPCGEIKVDLTSDQSGIRFVVSNSGTGIQPEDRNKVCEAFIRLDHDQPGAGMGLHIVSDVAKAHRVELAFEYESPGKSEPGLRAILGPFPLIEYRRKQGNKMNWRRKFLSD